MRIEQFRIDGFGRLRGLETGSLGPLVVVVGPNEAGKSTLFSFLTTALYGFSPASRDRNPHVPWDADEAGGSVRIRLSDDRCAVIERKLRSAPSARLSLDGVTTDLRNQPLPWVDHIPRAVFRQVFAVTLAELAGLDETTWARIQDRVLGSMGATDLRSPRAVAEALEQEAREVWRPSRRGNQKLRALRDEGRALRLRRAEALDRDRQIRVRVEEHDTVIRALGDARVARQQEKAALDLVNELLPVKRQLDRIEQLRFDGGDSREISGLPVGLAEAIRSVEERMTEASRVIDELGRDCEGPRLQLEACTDQHRTLFEHEGEIDVFLSRVAAFENERTLIPGLEAETGELDVQLRTVGAHVFVDGQSSAWESVTRLPVDLLLDRVTRLEASRRSAVASVAASGPDRRPLVALLLASAGAGLLAWGVLGGPGAAVALGVGLLVLGAGIFGLSTRSSAPRDQTEPSGELESDIATMLADVPLRDAPGTLTASHVQAIRRVQELAASRESAIRTLDTIRTRRDDLDAEAAALGTKLGFTTAADSADRFAAQLRLDMRDAERARSQAEVAGRELARLERAVEKESASRLRLEDERAALMQQVFRVTGRTDVQAIAKLQARLVAHEDADRLEAELRRQYDDLDERIARIRDAEAADAEWAYRPEEVASLRSRIETLDAEIEELVGRAETLTTEINHLRDRETVDSVDGAIMGLREREAAMSAARDRTWILAQIIREADRSFREKHQPDLVRRASEHLASLTEGRYNGLLIDEAGGGDLFQVVGPGLPKPVPLAAPISTGTLEQAYLSIRLAIVDHLDHGSEKLPLFIDEAFANWDAPRRDRGFDVLRELSESRQVFAFTCHPHMADLLEARGARVLKLDR